MSGAYLPVTREVRDRANAYLAGMAARGFVPPPMDDIERVRRMMSERTGFRPNRILLPPGRLERIVRRTMTKRQWRRLRGRLKEGRRRVRALEGNKP